MAASVGVGRLLSWHDRNTSIVSADSVSRISYHSVSVLPRRVAPSSLRSPLTKFNAG